MWVNYQTKNRQGISMGIFISVSWSTIVCKVLSWGISMWELHNDPNAGHMILRPGQNRRLQRPFVLGLAGNWHESRVISRHQLLG